MPAGDTFIPFDELQETDSLEATLPKDDALDDHRLHLTALVEVLDRVGLRGGEECDESPAGDDESQKRLGEPARKVVENIPTF